MSVIRNRPPNLNHKSGFTLLEVLVAMVITAIIGVMAFKSFDGAAGASEETQRVLEDINRVDRVWQTLGNDLFHVLPVDANTPFQGASLKSKGEDSSQMLLLFKRGNWVNFANRPRSDIQLVSYRLEEGKLFRDFVPETNRPVSDMDMERQAFHQLLLDDVEDVQLRFLYTEMVVSEGKSILEREDYSEDWLHLWPDTTRSGAAGIPLALEVTINLKGVGPSVRLFTFP
ncbi:MAG: type II secretion system minor pseudopilin GspJ [Cellvibrio sp.]|nr:type II secretion system minor pseudopilin GspJ [Cellvibrio sp.]